MILNVIRMLSWRLLEASWRPTRASKASQGLHSMFLKSTFYINLMMTRKSASKENSMRMTTKVATAREEKEIHRMSIWKARASPNQLLLRITTTRIRFRKVP
jgi:hypothetical protein